MEWKWNGDGNKKEVRYGIEKEWNRREIECRVKFEVKENVAEIQGKLDFRCNWKMHGTENIKWIIRMSMQSDLF